MNVPDGIGEDPSFRIDSKSDECDVENNWEEDGQPGQSTVPISKDWT